MPGRSYHHHQSKSSIRKTINSSLKGCDECSSLWRNACGIYPATHSPLPLLKHTVRKLAGRFLLTSRKGNLDDSCCSCTYWVKWTNVASASHACCISCEFLILLNVFHIFLCFAEVLCLLFVFEKHRRRRVATFWLKSSKEDELACLHWLILFVASLTFIFRGVDMANSFSHSMFAKASAMTQKAMPNNCMFNSVTNRAYKESILLCLNWYTLK